MEDIDIFYFWDYTKDALHSGCKGEELLSISERALSDVTGVLVADL